MKKILYAVGVLLLVNTSHGAYGPLFNPLKSALNINMNYFSILNIGSMTVVGKITFSDGTIITSTSTLGGGGGGGSGDVTTTTNQTISGQKTFTAPGVFKSSVTIDGALEVNAPDGRQVLFTDTSGDWLSFYLHPTNQDLWYWKNDKTFRFGTTLTRGGSTLTNILDLNTNWITFYKNLTFESSATYKAVNSSYTTNGDVSALNGKFNKVYGDGRNLLMVSTKTINISYSFDVVVATSQFVAISPATWIFNNNQNRVYNITGVQFGLIYASTIGPCSFNIAVSTTSDGTNIWYYMFTGSVTINTNSVLSTWSTPNSYATIDVLPTKMALHILEAPVIGSLPSSVTVNIQYWRRED